MPALTQQDVIKNPTESAKAPKFSFNSIELAKQQSDRLIFDDRIRQHYKTLTGVLLPSQHVERIKRIPYRALLELVVELDFADSKRLPIGGADRIIESAIVHSKQVKT